MIQSKPASQPPRRFALLISYRKYFWGSHISKFYSHPCGSAFITSDYNHLILKALDLEDTGRYDDIQIVELFTSPLT
jgi:hypothetical protein